MLCFYHAMLYIWYEHGEMYVVSCDISSLDLSRQLSQQQPQPLQKVLNPLFHIIMDLLLVVMVDKYVVIYMMKENIIYYHVVFKLIII